MHIEVSLGAWAQLGSWLLGESVSHWGVMLSGVALLHVSLIPLDGPASSIGLSQAMMKVHSKAGKKSMAPSELSLLPTCRGPEQVPWPSPTLRDGDLREATAGCREEGTGCHRGGIEQALPCPQDAYGLLRTQSATSESKMLAPAESAPGALSASMQHRAPPCSTRAKAGRPVWALWADIGRGAFRDRLRQQGRAHCPVWRDYSGN